MKAKIVAMTQPWGDVPCASAEELLYYFARVSNTAGQTRHKTGPHLIRGLIERREWSPLEMINIVFEVEVERDITRQIIRHKMDFQEFSQRWAEVPTNESVRRAARIQNPKDRSIDLPCTDPSILRWWDNQQGAVLDLTGRIYKEALYKGLAKTVARSVLPEGLTLSKIYINGKLRNWIHYIQARHNEHAQLEHQEVASAIRDAIEWNFKSALKYVKI